MGTKTISKREDNSFSDAVRREFSKKGSILDLAGAWLDLSDNDAMEMEKSIKKFRECTRKHVMERIKFENY